MVRKETPEQFATSLLKAQNDAVIRTTRIVNKSARTIREEAKANVQKSAPIDNGGAWRAITADDAELLPGWKVGSEVGYSRHFRAARLGNLLEYGGGGDKSPAHRDIGRAADAEEPRFKSAIEQMVSKLL